MDNISNSFIQNLSISYECSLSIGNSLIIEEMLNEVIHTIVHKTNAQRGTIWLFKEKEELQMGARAGSKLTKEEISKRKISFRSLFKQIYLTQKTVIKFKKDKDFLQYCNKIIGKEEAVLIIPIKKEAILHLVYSKKDIVTETLANMLCGLSIKLSIAIKACLEHKNIVIEIQKRIKSEKKYRDLFEKSKDAILLIHNDRFVDCNQAAINLLKYDKKEDFLNMSPAELSPEKQPDGKLSSKKADEMMEIAFKNGSHRFEWYHQKSDGEIFPVEMMLTAISNGEKDKILHTVWRDITERKRTDKIQKTLFNISSALNTTENMYLLCQKVRKFLGDVIDVQNFYIALYDEETDIISLPFKVDKKDQYESFPAGKSLTKYVIQSGKPLFATYKLQNKMIKQGKIEMIGTQSEIWLGAPLKIDDLTIGVIAVQSYDNPNLYTEKDIEILTYISEEIALAIKHKQANEKIKRNLKEKETLLGELYHRTQNNMQVISSMLRIQSRGSDIKFVQDSFIGIINKINAMSLVHQKLYQSQDLSQINLKDYIIDLSYLLKRSHGEKSKFISFKLDLESIFLLIDSAIPIGLILNEIISNSFNHAFPNNKKGEITIKLFMDKNETINIYLSDNGIGIPIDLDLRKNDSIGLQNIFSLVEYQLQGQVRYDTDNGLKWQISFKDNLHYKRV
ncbi:MAG: GAF domain-containing protein [Candidatus Cloacimonetes bacterium]|nr:GAF domain-containing protein [Candidatus Cloacimonadota bacterium]